MYSKTAAVMVGLAAAGATGVGLFALGAGVLDLDNPWVGLTFFLGGAGVVAGLVLGLAARGLWRDRAWAWVLATILGGLALLVAWQQAPTFADGTAPLVVVPGVAGAVLIVLVALRVKQAWTGRRSPRGT